MTAPKQEHDSDIPDDTPKKRGSKAASNKRRNRVPISCTICRRRKVKCDKRRPVCAACERTGVAHLCHYIDPPWAQPLSNEELNQGDSAEVEVEKLREKVAHLEQQLQLAKSGDVVPDPESPESQDDSTTEPLENDSLNLGKKFDMLHIKSTTTVHLGATSWLAIMKGDPYLRVLWAHIFKMRKQAEEFKFRKNMMKQQQQGKILTNGATPQIASPRNPPVPTSAGNPMGKCPVAHTDVFKSAKEKTNTDEQACPVSGKTQSMGKCPVAHDMESSEASASAKRSRDEDDAEETEDTDSPTTEEDDRVCPLMIGDNSFLVKMEEQHINKKKKTYRSDSSESAKSNPRRVSPEDFKANPVEMMQKYLPKKKVLWLFIERFFEVVYIYLPYVDEEQFREEVETIMGGADDEDQNITIQIRSGIDFALVGTVCIILRLVWNTLPTNNSNKLLGKSVNTKSYVENMEALAVLQKPENEIPLELVDCVKHCFSNLKLMRKSSLKIVQCGLYMRYYFMYSPEDGDGADGGESQIFLGMIIQMAISIGLHRDPNNFENFGNERQRHLWRKIWFAILSLDVTQSVNLGCPRGLQNHHEFSDTRIPGSIKDGADLEEFKNDLRELSVIKNIHTQAKIDDLVSKTMKVLLNVNAPAKRYQVDSLIKELQHSISGFGVTQDEFALPQLGKILVNRAKGEPLYSSGTRAIQFRSHVAVNMLIYLLNYILYVHFEPRGAQDPQLANIARTYAQKALNCSLEGYRNCTLFFDCGLEYFGPGADLVLSPMLLLVGHRSMQFMVSLILRSRCGPFMKANVVETPSSERGGSIEPEKMQKKTESDGHHVIDNRNHDLDNIEIRDESEDYHSTFDVDVNSGETLSTILLEHMVKFHQLAEKLGKKYPYSWRMGKAVSFFITLLKKPTNVVKTMVKTENVKSVENNTGEISTVLNSVPLVLSADEEELRKCPVFMKAEESATRSTVSTHKEDNEASRLEEHQRQILHSQAQIQHHQAQIRALQQQMPMASIGGGADGLRMFQPQPFQDSAQGAPLFPGFPPAGSIAGSEMEMEMMPELGPAEGFVNLTEAADRSLGDMFGVTLGAGNSSSAAFMNDLTGGNLEGGDMGMPNMDFSAMMNGGNWFA